jgi:hypothetical protein
MVGADEITTLLTHLHDQRRLGTTRDPSSGCLHLWPYSAHPINSSCLKYCQSLMEEATAEELASFFVYAMLRGP